MYCSLYSESNTNVGIATARQQNVIRREAYPSDIFTLLSKYNANIQHSLFYSENV